MLCPEIWKFPTKQNANSYQIGNYDKKGKQTVDRLITSYAFNDMVSIILPGCETIPPPIKQLIDAGDYYLVRNLKLSELVRKDLVEAFIKRGRLTGISFEVGIINSCANVFSITPDGKLILSINRDLYHILGLEGRPVGLQKRNEETFEISIDLKNKDLNQQSKSYLRIRSSLSNPQIETFDFKLSWNSIDATVCPSSVAKFFNDCGYKVEQHGIQIHSTIKNDLKIPSQLYASRKIDAYLAHAMVEYFATVMLECDGTSCEEVNTFRPATDLNLNASEQAMILNIKGFLTVDFISKLMELSRLSVNCNSIIFNVSGCEKATYNGSKGYIITLLEDTNYFLFKT